MGLFVYQPVAAAAGAIVPLAALPSATASVAVPVIYALSTGRIWLLRAGTDADDGVGLLRPADYNAATNAKVFEMLL